MTGSVLFIVGTLSLPSKFISVLDVREGKQGRPLSAGRPHLSSGLRVFTRNPIGVGVGGEDEHKDPTSRADPFLVSRIFYHCGV